MTKERVKNQKTQYAEEVRSRTKRTCETITTIKLGEHTAFHAAAEKLKVNDLTPLQVVERYREGLIMRRQELMIYFCSRHVIRGGKRHIQFSYGGPIGRERSQRGNSEENVKYIELGRVV